jgi:dTDP-glucose 4,6-dehydratase
MSKKILITGIGGFIGSHFLSHVLVNTDWEVIGIDSWRHKGISERLTDNEHYKKHFSRVNIFTHDLTAPLSEVLIDKIGYVDYVVNFASQSHVDRSITDPVPFVQNNVNLILNVLEYCRAAKPEKLIQISTDEVYGATDGKYTHKEWEAILPSNPYSASKACQEAIAISYWRTYGVPVIITNIMNTAGEYQSSEKYVPMVIKKILNGDKVQVHSDPKTGEPGSRYWLHARNTSDAILFLLNNVPSRQFPEVDRPERFNIVGEKQISNLDIAQMIADVMDKDLNYELVDAHSSRPGHDPHYGLCGKKLESYGYKFPVNLHSSLEKMIKWTLENPRWLK